MTLPEATEFFIKESTRFVSPEAVAAEWVLVGIAALVTAVAPVARAKKVRDVFCRFANHRRAAILFCGILPVGLRFALLPWIPVPDPSIHDEFSHLLLADTLAHGRLTNPTHPMWQHFETIHVIQKPTYASMYPPAQDSFLALGQVLFHEPWAGVVISVGLMCAVCCWMMQAWMPPAWAVYGSLLIVLKLGVQGFWMNSYLGGAVPAIGGALLIGSLPRLKEERSRALTAVLLGLGLVILMNTRPFEGGVLAAAALVYLLPALARKFRWKRREFLRKVVLPAAVVLGCGALFTGYYNWRVTGKPLRMGYQVNRDTYGWPENLAFLPAKKVTLRHKVLQDMYVKEAGHREIYQSAEKLLDNLVTRVFDSWTFLLGPLLTIPLLFLPWIFRDPRTRPLIIFVALIAFLNLFQMLLYPFHLGPIIPTVFGLVTLGVRQLYRSISALKAGREFSFALVLPLCVILIGAMKEEALALNLPLSYWEIAAEPHRDARASIEEWLKERPGKQLVIVRYAPWHSVDQEWVYNGADIDGSKIVWARAMDAESDAELVRYFADREVWTLNADAYPPRVVPYSPPSAPKK